MKEQKLVSKWLSVAGVKGGKTPKYPSSERLQLALKLIMEELTEAAQSGGNDELGKFLVMAQDTIDQANAELISNRFAREGSEESIIDLRDACSDLRVVLGNLIHFSGLKKCFDDDYTEVMKSNFSKFCETEKEAKKSVKAYEDGTHPNKVGSKIECYYHESNGYYIIRRRLDKKIMKSINYKEPKLK